MISAFQAAFRAAMAWLRSHSNKAPKEAENEGQGGDSKEATPQHGQQPTTDVSRTEWTAIQAAIREIHASEEQHQAAERNIWAAQIRAANRLNWITAIGAIVGLLG